MLFTFGYNTSPDSGDVLMELVNLLDATIVDVRLRPHGKRGWRANDLSRQFGAKYEWNGTLGGRAFAARSSEWIEAPAIALRPLVERHEREHLILLCACGEPWSCHRHHELAVPLLKLGVETMHLHGEQAIAASDLQTALRDGTPYPYEDLCDWLEGESH